MVLQYPSIKFTKCADISYLVALLRVWTKFPSIPLEWEGAWCVNRQRESTDSNQSSTYWAVKWLLSYEISARVTLLQMKILPSTTIVKSEVGDLVKYFWPSGVKIDYYQNAVLVQEGSILVRMDTPPCLTSYRPNSPFVRLRANSLCIVA